MELVMVKGEDDKNPAASMTELITTHDSTDLNSTPEEVGPKVATKLIAHVLKTQHFITPIDKSNKYL